MNMNICAQLWGEGHAHVCVLVVFYLTGHWKNRLFLVRLGLSTLVHLHSEENWVKKLATFLSEFTNKKRQTKQPQSITCDLTFPNNLFPHLKLTTYKGFLTSVQFLNSSLWNQKKYKLFFLFWKLHMH